MFYPIIFSIIVAISLSNVKSINEVSNFVYNKQIESKSKFNELSIAKNLETIILNGVSSYIRINSKYVYNELNTNGYLDLFLSDISNYLPRNIDLSKTYASISKINIDNNNITIYYNFQNNEKLKNFQKFSKRNSSTVSFNIPTMAKIALDNEKSNVYEDSIKNKRNEFIECIQRYRNNPLFISECLTIRREILTLKNKDENILEGIFQRLKNKNTYYGKIVKKKFMFLKYDD